MSDRMMTVDEARDVVEVLEGFRLAHVDGLSEFEEQTLKAARTIAAVGEVLALLDREYTNVSRSNPLPREASYAAGYLAGIDTAYTWIKEEIGDIK